MIIGYARVSTVEQNLDLQIDALIRAGCEKVFTDVISGSEKNKTGLNDALSILKEGDTLIVWKLDRFGRSMHHIIKSIKYFNEKKINFLSIQESIDTKTSNGKLVFHMQCALAEFERDLIIERTNAGLKAARERGRIGGRKLLFDPEKIQSIVNEYMFDKKATLNMIASKYSITSKTLLTYIKKYAKLSKKMIFFKQRIEGNFLKNIYKI